METLLDIREALMQNSTCVDFPPSIPEGALHPIIVDGVDKLIVMKNGSWVELTTGLPIPKGSDIKIVPIGQADRFGRVSNTVNKGHADVESNS